MSQLDTIKFSSPEQTRTRLPPLPYTPAFLGRPRAYDPPSSQFFSTSRGCFSTGVTQLDDALAVPTTLNYSSPLAARWRQTRLQSQSQPQPQSQSQSQSQNEEEPSSSSLTGVRLCAPGGVRRGEVTEVTGSKGVGKTAFAMGIAARALVAGEKVMWVDTSSPVCLERLQDILRAEITRKRTTTFDESTPLNEEMGKKTTIQNEIDSALTRLIYFHAPTLAHLMALISSPPPGFPPHDTGLLVLDNISTLFSTEFKPFLPKHTPTAPAASSGRRRPDPAEKQDKLRWKLLAALLSNLRKLALRLDAAVLTVNEMGSRFRDGRRPVLHQVVSGVTWDLGVAARLVLYFTWLTPAIRTGGGMGGMRRVRVAEVLRVGGGDVSGVDGDDDGGGKVRAVPFFLGRGGIVDVPAEAGLVVRRGTMGRSGVLKRKVGRGGMGSPVRRKVWIGSGGEEVLSDMEASQRFRDEHEHEQGHGDVDADDTEDREKSAAEDPGTRSLVEHVGVVRSDEEDMLATDAELLLANIPDDEDFE